jgi:hypothetical protein
VGASSVVVSVTLSEAGSVHCAAFISTKVPSSVEEVLFSDHVAQAVINNLANLTVTSLEAVTEYVLYCVTVSSKGTSSSFAQLVSAASKMSITTACCKFITVTLLQQTVFADRAVPNVATLSVPTLPFRDPLRVQISVYRNDTRKLMFFPSEVVFSFCTPRMVSLAFVGDPDSGIGWYNVSVRVLGNTTREYAAIFTDSRQSIQNFNGISEPPTPSIEIAVFSSDGATVSIIFSAPTDRGVTKGISVFACSELFVFSGASQSTCRWSADSAAITVSPSRRYPFVVGSPLTLPAGILRAMCTTGNGSSCRSWATVANKTLNVVAPSFILKPLVQLTLPAIVGSCDSLTLDFTASLNSGGRVWTSINVSVATEASNTSELLAYLQSYHRFDHPVIVPNKLLPKGCVLTFTVNLCNFLYAC